MHLSGEMSGTFESAQLAARDASLPVRVVDTRQLGMATGYAVLAAAEVARAGRLGRGGRRRRAGPGRRDHVAVLRRHPGVPPPRRPDRRGRRPARLGAGGQAAAGDRGRPDRHPGEGADGGPALSRLEELAVTAAEDRQVDVAVAHLASPDRAASSPSTSAAGSPANLSGREVSVGEVGAVIGAHVGPGMVAVVVAPLPERRPGTVHSPAGAAGLSTGVAGRPSGPGAALPRFGSCAHAGPANEQVAEVARRRLELLSAELAAIRPDPVDPPSSRARDGSGEPPPSGPRARTVPVSRPGTGRLAGRPPPPTGRTTSLRPVRTTPGARPGTRGRDATPTARWAEARR